MSSRRLSNNGRSPLVNPQRQITSFFTKSSNSSPSSPSPSPASVSSKLNPKSLLNPKPSKPINQNRSPSPSPTTPSPLQSKQKNKPLLVIGPSQPSPSTPTDDAQSKSTPLYGQEVVNRRIKVYWPLDNSWYEGCVKSFDQASGEHLILYDDAQEEVLDLSKEKTQWCDDELKTPKFRRLRRVSVVEDDDEVKTPNSMDVVEDDDSTDEDWGKNVDIEAADEDDDLKAMDLDKEEEEEKNVASASKTQGSKKRTMSDEWMLGIFKKKSKSAGDAKKTTSKLSGDCNGGKLTELKAGVGKW